jgi:hypothetical protein
VTITDDTTGAPTPSGGTRLSDGIRSGTAGTGTFGTLLVTELKRVRARRITRVLLLGLVGVLVIIWIGYAWGSRPLSAAEQQQSQSYLDEATTEFHKYCNNDGTVKAGVDENLSPFGDCTFPPEADQYVYTRSSHFSDLPGASLAFAGLAAAVMLLLAASMVGADLTPATSAPNCCSCRNGVACSPRALSRPPSSRPWSRWRRSASGLSVCGW